MHRFLVLPLSWCVLPINLQTSLTRLPWWTADHPELAVVMLFTKTLRHKILKLIRGRRYVFSVSKGNKNKETLEACFQLSP